MPIGSEAPWRGRRIDPHVVAEVLAAELGADAEILGELADLRFEREVAEGAPVRRAGRRQGVEVAGGGELDGLQVELGGQAADHDGEVIGRAGGRAEGQDLFLQEGEIRSWVRIEGVAWNRKVLLAEPPPLAMNRNL